jgi:hypothetical protein
VEKGTGAVEVEGPKPLLAALAVDRINLRIRGFGGSSSHKSSGLAFRESGVRLGLGRRRGLLRSLRRQRTMQSLYVELHSSFLKQGVDRVPARYPPLETILAAPMGFPGCFRMQQHRLRDSGQSSSPGLGMGEQLTALIHCSLCRFQAQCIKTTPPPAQ